MKKFLTIAAVALVAMSVQAAQINWGIAGQVKFNNTLVGDKAVFTLVCLDGVADWSAYAKDIASGATTDGVVKTKNTNTSSVSMQNADPWKFEWAGSTDIASGSVAKGTDFAFVVTYKDGTDTYFWASDVYTVTDSGSNWNSTANSYTINITSANAMGTTGTNWTAVPEPASAMLALAGVAMLIRRRK